MGININNAKKEILEWLEKYKTETNCKGVVLGISGGKDSTVVAMLAKKIWGDNVFGILMPNGTQIDLEDSLNIAKCIGIQHRIVNLETVYNSLLHVIETQLIEAPWAGGGYHDFAQNCPPVSEKAKTNIPPRLRMTTLYAVAQTMGYRVIGTGNASEAYIGWTTKWGDSAYDINPIAHLTCTEVITLGKELAKEFGLDEKYVDKAPSDGLTGKSDEDNFGFTYDELDKFIRNDTTVPDETKMKIEKLHSFSEHKRKMPYRMADAYTLAPCPFCGGKVKLVVCDHEGNIHDDDYENDPWSGLSYAIDHDVNSNPDCPIAHDPSEFLGRYLYDTREEAITTWNSKR